MTAYTMQRTRESLVYQEQELGKIEDAIAKLEKRQLEFWEAIMKALDFLAVDRIVLPNGMILARVKQHHTTFDDACGENLLPSSLWPKVTMRKIDPGAYDYALKRGEITSEQDAQIRTVKESWEMRHQPATKKELRELKSE